MCVGKFTQNKDTLREKYKYIRKNTPYKKIEMMNETIFNGLISTNEYQKSKIILTYVSKEFEVYTHKIIKHTWSENKYLAVPKCDKSPIKMQFYYIKSKDDLEKGHFGIYEPKESTINIVKDFSGALCIVPGLAFDEKGYRLGFGKGYYDRFLAIFNGISVGICYSNCIEHEIPRDEYDIPVDILITDKYIKKFYKF